MKICGFAGDSGGIDLLRSLSSRRIHIVRRRLPRPLIEAPFPHTPRLRYPTPRRTPKEGRSFPKRPAFLFARSPTRASGRDPISLRSLEQYRSVSGSRRGEGGQPDIPKVSILLKTIQ